MPGEHNVRATLAEHTNCCLGASHYPRAFVAVWQVKRVMRHHDLHQRAIERRKAFVKPLHLLLVDPPALEGHRTRSVDPGHRDLAVGIERLELLTDEAPVLIQ